MSITDEVGVRIKGDLATQFKEKCMAQGIKYTDALRTLVQAYRVILILRKMWPIL